MKALDLFCCGGGATKGLQLAGFEVTGVDIVDQGKYYIGDFIQGDVLDIEQDFLAEFDFIWASPPCQKYSKQTKQHSDKVSDHTDLVDATRELLDKSGKPYTIENVISSPLREDLMLCGKMFGLNLARHRIFEVKGFEVYQPKHPNPHPGRVVTVTGHTGGTSKRDGGSRYGTLADWKEAMGIDWLPARLLKEAIPPAYSYFIAIHFMLSNNF